MMNGNGTFVMKVLHLALGQPKCSLLGAKTQFDRAGGGQRTLVAVWSNAIIVFVSHREHLGAVRVPAGSESFEALIYYCINKAKKSTANKNNNSRFKKRTDVSTSQTQQAHASQASEQREHLSSPSKKKWKSTLRKSPCLHLSSLLRWLHPREDRKSLLASMDIVPSNYGSLL